MNNSDFLYFGTLPSISIHTPKEDEYSKMYIPREKCDCGCSEWITGTFLLGLYQNKIPCYKDVHRCKDCNEVRMADHIGSHVDN